MSDESHYKHHGDNVEVPVGKNKVSENITEDVIYWIIIAAVASLFLVKPMLDFYRSI
jgi:hypothetical protein